MNLRLRAFGALGLAVAFLSGCAAGAGPGTAGGTAAAFDEADLPDWIEALPEGEPPRDNEHTAEAELFLFQAQQADGDDARQFYEQVLEAAYAGIEADPENSQSYFQAGVAYLGLEEYEQAGEMLDRAEEIYPRYVIDTELLREEAWIEAYNDGVEHLPDNPDAARPHLERAHTMFQGRPEAMLQLAEIYNDMGMVDEAIDLYTQAVEVATGPRAEAVEDEELREIWLASVEIARYNQAQLLFEAGRYEESAEVYQLIHDENPDDLLALGNLAASLLAAGETERANQLYDDLLGRDDLTVQDYISIGVGLYEADDLVQAARAFGMAHELVPNHRDALYNYAQSLYLADQTDELLSVAERLVELDTHNENAHLFLTQALVEADRQDDAVDVLEMLEALPFDLDGFQLQPDMQGASLFGQAWNRTEPAGSEVRILIHFLDLDGNQIGTEEIAVPLGEPEEPVGFQVDFNSDVPVAGFYYEVPS